MNRIRLEAVLPTKSVVWEERYNGVGKMQAVFTKNADSLEYIRVGKFAVMDNNLRIMYIYGIKMTDTEIWAYGYEAHALLQKKAMMNFGTNDGEVDIGQAITNAINTYGGYSFISTLISAGLGTANLDGIEYNNVYEYVSKCLSLGNNGWSAFYNQSTGTIMLTSTTGIDQSDYYLFASELGNVNGVSYAYDDQNYISRVYAVGDNNGQNVFVYEEDTNPMNEVTSAYLDCRMDFPKPDDMSLSDYEDALHTRARMSLIARHAKETLTVKNIDTSMYNSYYFLGDIVTVAVPEYDVKKKMRIVCARHTFEGGIETLAMELALVA